MVASRKPQWVAVSGGFDPMHVGHLRMCKAARALGDKLVVILNNDNWLQAKKGFVFMPQKERAEILREFPFVDKVVFTDHTIKDADRSVVRTLKKLRPAIFANGGDRHVNNAKNRSSSLNADQDFCRKNGIKMVFNVGKGGKVQSSSWMIGAVRRPASQTIRPWGAFFGWDAGKDWNLKTVYIKPGKRLSLQYHDRRSELWILVAGDATATTRKGKRTVRKALTKGAVFAVGRGVIHRLESKRGGIVVEVALGAFDENDIVRLEDDHGRTPTH